MAEVTLNKDSRAASDRARGELAAQLAISGTYINPEYVSIVNDAKPKDYVEDTGQPRGAYPKSTGGIQLVVWNFLEEIWQDYGQTFASLEWVELQVDSVSQRVLDIEEENLDARVNALELTQVAGLIGFTTKALMDADETRDDGTIAMVTNDSTIGNNGFYRYNEGTTTWVKTTSQYEEVLNPVTNDNAPTSKAIADYIPEATEEYTNLETESFSGSVEDHPYAISSLETFPEDNAIFRDNTSTFSGWNTPLGTPQNFTRLIFKVGARSTPITQLRVRISTGAATTTDIISEIINVPIAAQDTEVITWDFDTIENSEGAKLYFSWQADELAVLFGVSGESPFPEADGYLQTRYWTDGDISVSNGSVSGGRRRLWVKIELIGSIIGVKDNWKEYLIERLGIGNQPIDEASILRSGFPSYGKSYNRQYLSKIAKLKTSGTDTLRIALIGDSWINGLSRVYTPIRAYIDSHFENGSPGYVCANTSYNVPTGAVRNVVGDWDNQIAVYGVDCGNIYSITNGDYIEFSADGYTSLGYRIHYMKIPNGGEFEWSIGGGAATEIDTNSSSTTLTVLEVSGSGTLKIEVTDASTNGVIICGVEILCTVTGKSIVHKLGASGARADRFTGIQGESWRTALASLNPDICLIVLGTNDNSSNIALSTFKANIQTIVDRIKDATPLCDILLVQPGPNGLVGKTYTIEEYGDQLFDIAYTQNLSFIDLKRFFGEYADANSRGLYSDPAHPNSSAGQVIANAIISELLTIPT